MRARDKLCLLVSQAINAAMGGDPDEALSARAWREGRDAWVNRIDAILGTGHCKMAYAMQKARQTTRHLG